MNILKAAALALCLSQCAAAADKPNTVLATIFPVYDIAKNIAGDRMEVKLLTPPGAEAHSFEPKPSDIIAAKKAVAFIYTNDAMEPWAKRFASTAAGKNTLVIEAGKDIPLLPAETPDEHAHHAHAPRAHGHADGDPHVWMDLDNAARMAETIAAGLGEKDSANKTYYAANAVKFSSELKKLDARYKTALSSCGRREIIFVGHMAFAYMARRYGLKFTAAQGVIPESEPTPAKLVALARQLKASGAKYVFTDDEVSGRFAKAVAGETGAQVLRLNPIHEIKKNDFASGATFISIMERNLSMLERGLECGKR